MCFGKFLDEGNNPVHAVQAFKTYKLGGKISELLYSPAAYGIDLSSQHILKPRARANTMMTVCGNKLVLMGGIVEVCILCLRSI